MRTLRARLSFVPMLVGIAAASAAARGGDAPAVPAAAPADAVTAPAADVAAARAWAEGSFAGVPAATAGTPRLDLLFRSTAPPFSFTLGGVPSDRLLATWRHSATSRDLPDRVEIIARWDDPASGLSVTATAGVFKDTPAVDWVLSFAHGGEKDSPLLEDVQALDVALATPPTAGPVVLRRIAGDDCSPQSFHPIARALAPGESERLAPVGGRSSNGTFPFFDLARGDDQGLFAAIGWSGQWAATIARDAADGSTRLRAGMERTSLVLHPGEAIRTPRVLLMAWAGDRTDAHNRFRRLLLHHYVPKVDGRPVALPVFWQTFDRYRNDPAWPSTEGQLAAVAVAAASGADFYWLDASWFPGGFPNGVGSWEPGERFPGGLRPIADACHARGMRFVAWFEPERVAPGSRIAREHPEFVHGGSAGGLFRLDDPAARRWMTDLLSTRIGEFGLDWYRNDFNMNPLDTWRGADPPDRQGMTEIRYVEGLYAMWDELRARHPGLVIDNCASGGRRIDLETCLRSVPLWQSDLNCGPGHADAHQAQSVALSLYLPLHCAVAWEPTAYELRSTATAGMILQLPFLEPGYSASETRALVERTQAIRPFWYGDLYPLTSITPEPSASLAFELWRPDLGAGVILAFRRANAPDAPLIVHPRGLDPEATYQITSEDGSVPPTTLRGADLMAAGLSISLPGPRSSDVIHIFAGSRE